MRIRLFAHRLFSLLISVSLVLTPAALLPVDCGPAGRGEYGRSGADGGGDVTWQLGVAAVTDWLTALLAGGLIGVAAGMFGGG